MNGFLVFSHRAPTVVGKGERFSQKAGKIVKYEMFEKVTHNGERAIIKMLGNDPRGWGMAIIRLQGQRERTVYISKLRHGWDA